MAYTRAWDETQPLGTAAANTIDDIFRALKVDIRERMNSVLDPSGQWGADPIRLLGTKDRVLTIGANGFYPAADFVTFNVGPLSGDFQLGARCALPVRAGWGITKIQVIADKLSTTRIDSYWTEVDFSTTPASNTLNYIQTLASGIQLITLHTGSTHTVAANKSEHITVAPPSGTIRIYGLQVTYNEY